MALGLKPKVSPIMAFLYAKREYMVCMMAGPAKIGTSSYTKLCADTVTGINKQIGTLKFISQEEAIAMNEYFGWISIRIADVLLDIAAPWGRGGETSNTSAIHQQYISNTSAILIADVLLMYCWILLVSPLPPRVSNIQQYISNTSAIRLELHPK
jgi:hypothetical protein